MCLLDNLTAFFGSDAASSYATDPDRGLWTAQPPGPRLTVTGLRVVTDARTRPLGSVTCILLLLSARAALKPAIWLRCLIEAPAAPGLKGVVGNGAMPVILLPGISWRDLREPLTLMKSAQILVEMQYRGDVFRQRLA